MTILLPPPARPVQDSACQYWQVVETSFGKRIEEVNPSPPLPSEVVITPLDFGECLRLAEEELGGEPSKGRKPYVPRKREYALPQVWKSGDGFRRH